MIVSGVVPTVVAGGATVLGALGLYAVRRPSERVLHAMLGAAGGVMLGAVSFSLLVPALDGQDRGATAWLTLAFVLGALGTWGLGQALPHDADAIEGGVISGGSIEGGSIGAAVGRRTTLLVAALAFHNIPEGLAVAVALAALGASRGRAVLLSSLTGVVEVAAGMVGLALASLSAGVLSALLAAAAGAMLFVVVHEIGPETTRSGDQDTATFTLIVGFAAMILLDAFVG